MNEFLEYKDLYVQTGREYIQSLNASLLRLEKNPTDKETIEEVFRSAHSLKGQSAAMEYESTGFLCHTIEDVFYEIKNGRMALTSELSDHLFAAFDALTNSINVIEKENHEIDLSQQAETLKQLSGVKTEGVGRSQRADAKPDTPATNKESQPLPGPTPETNVQIPPAQTPEPTPALPPEPLSEPAKKQTDQPPADKNPSEPAQPVASPAASAINTIAVKVEVLDEMMNLLENLLIQRLKLKHITDTSKDDNADLKDYFNASEKILVSLQYQIMKARAVPVSLVFEHFPRAVRDLARAENKHVELVVAGGDLELDRTIVDRLDEPLIHLLRNAVSHGIKDSGTITLSAERQKDYAQISVADNGQGIDWSGVAQKAGLPESETNSRVLKDALFSGISTSETVTQISGRGVGLMAIKKMVDNFGGTIDVISETGKGTAFVIKLPLTLAIAKALIVTVNGRHFAIPTLAVVRIVSVAASAVKKIAGQEAFVLDEADIPLIRLDKKLTPWNTAQPPASLKDTAVGTLKDLVAVIVGEREDTVGLVVDEVLDTADIVIKPVPDILKEVSGFAGVTILSDGKTALIINPQELL